MRPTERDTSLGDHRRPYSVVGFGVPPLLDEDARTVGGGLGSAVVQRVRARGLTVDAITYTPLGSDEWSRAGRCTCAQRLRPCVRKERTISAEASGPAGPVYPTGLPPYLPATMDRPGFSDDHVVDVAVYSACARMTSGLLAVMRRR
jgi:hypothetical protein